MRLISYEPPFIDYGLIYVKIWGYHNGYVEEVPLKELKQLKWCVENYDEIKNGELGGSLEMLLVLGNLIRDNLIDAPNDIYRIVYNVYNRYSSYYFTSPIRLNLNNRFYLEGLALCMFVKAGEMSFEQYELEEVIIGMLCDCHAFLTTDIPKFHTPSKLQPGILHSVMAFAQFAHKNRIYPYKANQVLNVIREMNVFEMQSNYVDYMLLKFFCGSRVVRIEEVDKQLIVPILSELGRLSFYYHNSELFKELMLGFLCSQSFEGEAFNDVSCKEIIGMALGIISVISHE